MPNNKPGDKKRPIIRILTLLGITTCLVGAGFLIYPYYTNFLADRSQNELSANLPQARPAANLQGPADPPPASSAPPDRPYPQKGEPIGRIQIPKINVDWVFVEGIDPEDLKKGPGHYPGTPLPGGEGNAAIAGHRTTYGAPFNRLDELQQGDEITVTNGAEVYLYRVAEIKIVDPSDLSVVAPTADSRLTLTTCNPKFSAKQRLIIVAGLQNPPVRAGSGQ